MSYKLAPEGKPFIVYPLGAALLSFALHYLLPATPIIGFVLCSIMWLALGLTLFNLWFFRDPVRITPDDPYAVISPGDGLVVDVSNNKIAIFLSVFDVHVNRSPIAGKVISKEYIPGRFAMAFRPDTSTGNERNMLTIKHASGQEVVCTQIAGWIARRILCYAHVDHELKAGERYGMIRYGSRMELFLPPGTTINVKKGQRVRCGESIVAYLKNDS